MTDKILVNGMVWGTREPLVSPIDYDEFVKIMLEALSRDKEGFRQMAEFGQEELSSKKSFEYSFHTPDLNDPLEAKWALLLPPRSKENEAIAAALKPLVDHRQGQVWFSEKSIVVDQEKWIMDQYSQMEESDRPYYVLLAGKPEDIPFRFQYTLDVNAAVGRLSFDSPEEYARYAGKVVEFETNANSFVNKKAVFFATDHRLDDPTHISRRYMTNPLVKMIQDVGVQVSYFPGDQATLNNLQSSSGGADAPALIYTASHGLAVPGSDAAAEEDRRKMQGAIVCQDYNGHSGVFSADQVPAESFGHGSIFLAFACYGAGTPKESDFFHWIKIPSLLDCCPTQDFIAALPKRLLSHPQGPLAFVGHIDPAWVYSFADPDRFEGDKGWGTRMAPFRQAVDHLFQGATVGYAVKRFNEIYATFSVKLANIEDQFRRDTTRGGDPQWTKEMIDIWMIRNDTQNFIVLGDPAVKAKVR
jgi:hypothetical protein